MILVGGLIAVGAYKLSKKDVDQIEQHTGKKAEELSDEELHQAMDDLDIDGQELTDSDYEYLDQQAAADEAAAAQSQDSYLDELEKLAQLRDQGIITEAEFEAKKKQLLGL